MNNYADYSVSACFRMGIDKMGILGLEPRTPCV